MMRFYSVEIICKDNRPGIHAIVGSSRERSIASCSGLSATAAGTVVVEMKVTKGGSSPGLAISDPILPGNRTSDPRESKLNVTPAVGSPK